MKLRSGVFIYFGITVIFAFLAYHHFTLGLVVIVSYLHLLHYRQEKKVLFLLLSSWLFWILIFSYNHEKLDKIEKVEKSVEKLLVKFAEYPTFDGNKLSAYVHTVEGEKLALSYYIQTEKEKKDLLSRLQPNISCSVNGTIKTPNEPTNPNAFNYQEYLLTQKISYIVTVDTITHCREGKQSFYTQLLKIRHNGIYLINDIFSPSVAPFVNALLFGHKEGMEQETIEAYQQLGLSHLLAISGLHVTVISGFLYFVLLRIGLTREMVRPCLLLFLPLYVIITGAAPSVIRAVVMTWIILFLSKWKTTIHPLDALAISFIGFLLINPFIIYHVGFQLSYTVATGLLLSNILLKKTVNTIHASFMISVLSQFIALPILLNHFYEFSLLSVLLNIFYVPVYSLIILPLSLITYCFLFIFPPFAQIGVFTLNELLNVLNQLAKWVHQFEFFHVVLGKTPLVLFLVFYVTIFISLYILENYWMKKLKLLTLVLLIPFILQILVVKYSPIGEVVFIDVGQGDSILIRLPFNKGTYLIDTGGRVTFPVEDWQKRNSNFDPGKHIIVPLLKSKGITKIDKLILTHGDSDHIGSVDSIIEHFTVRLLLTGNTIQKKEMEIKKIEMAKRKGSRIIEVSSGMTWRIGNNEFVIVAPEKSAIASNDTSIGIYAKIGSKTWLFTGDIEKEGERKIVQKYPFMKVDILKVGHHGSRTSTTESLLSTIEPKIAIISAGESNRYGHPHREVLHLLREHRVTVYRTDQHGAIVYQYLFGMDRILLTKN